MPAGTAPPRDGARDPMQVGATRDEGKRTVAVVPLWAQAVGMVLLLAFVLLSVEAYAGPGLRNRLLGLGSGATVQSQAAPLRAFYVAGSTAQPGHKVVGSEGQERTLQEGDTVLLGATGRLVRIGPGGRPIELAVPDGATTPVVNLGSWDRATARLTGISARNQGGRWSVDAVPLASVGANLHPAGAPAEALTDGFWIGPDPDAGRIRRLTSDGRPALRIRASKNVPSLMLETRQPLPTLDDALVSVTAVVRGERGMSLTLILEDVAGSGQDQIVAVSERVTATEEWTRLTVRRRVAFPSPQDKIAVGLLDASAGDWFEVREFEVALGVAP